MLTAVFWDVQHGFAAYLATPSTPSKHIVIDLGVGSFGSGGATFSPLQHLHANGVARLDGVVITHPHRDHIDDIMNFDVLDPHVLHRPKHLTADAIRKANADQDKAIVDKYLAIDQRYSEPVPNEKSPFRPENNGGATFQFFAPTKCADTNINNHSIVTIVSHADAKILIPGDNEPPSWDELLAQPSFVQAITGTHVIVAPHHGRDSGFHAPLFEKIQPRLVIISDGQSRDTSGTGRYDKQATGLTVSKRAGGTETRKVVTTRNDGCIVLRVTPGTQGTLLEVTVN